MASDLPDQRPETSEAFARILVQTMRCDRAVQQRIREDFTHAPDERTIRRLRIEMALSKFPRIHEPCKPHDGYYPRDASDQLKAKSVAFLGLLRAAHPERFAA